jgi:hypothetical protein
LRPDLAVLVGTAGLALLLALLTGSHHPGGAPTIALGALGTIVLFGVCGVALAALMLPHDWGMLVPLLALPLGAAMAGLALTALGLATLPLHITLWLVLGLGLASIVPVVRRAAASPRSWLRKEPLVLAAWLGTLVLLFCVAMIPAWRTIQATIYGENPDAHQVAGIAVLFQHVPPTHTDVALPIDTVPPAWRFRYPIFYPLAGVSNLVHLDPIRVFPAMSALLVVIAALGFGAVAVTCLRVPRWGGPLVATAVGLSVVVLHLNWHPYWNQLWGLAMLPYVLLFGWQALERSDVRLAVLCAVMALMLWLGYPLALPEPLVILALLVIAYRRWPQPTRLLRSRSWILAVLGIVILAPAILGAALKLEQGISQLFSPSAALWGGDVTSFLPFGFFVGTGGGIIPALAVAGVAVVGLIALPRRVAWGVGLGVLALALVDIRFRTTHSGTYMDFKHLSYVGTLVLALAASGIVSLLARRRIAFVAAAALVAVAWSVAAVVQDRREILATGPQVTPELFQIRAWAQRLPVGASVRVDIPHSGTQLWAVYMLGSHPVDAPDPVLYTTYAHAPYGWRADYSLALRYYPLPGPGGQPRRFPRPLYARNPPVAENDEFALRRIVWPKRLDSYPKAASQTLVEP